MTEEQRKSYAEKLADAWPAIEKLGLVLVDESALFVHDLLYRPLSPDHQAKGGVAFGSPNYIHCAPADKDSNVLTHSRFVVYRPMDGSFAPVGEPVHALLPFNLSPVQCLLPLAAIWRVAMKGGDYNVVNYAMTLGIARRLFSVNEKASLEVCAWMAQEKKARDEIEATLPVKAVNAEGDA